MADLSMTPAAAATPRWHTVIGLNGGAPLSDGVNRGARLRDEVDRELHAGHGCIAYVDAAQSWYLFIRCVRPDGAPTKDGWQVALTSQCADYSQVYTLDPVVTKQFAGLSFAEVYALDSEVTYKVGRETWAVARDTGGYWRCRQLVCE